MVKSTRSAGGAKTQRVRRNYDRVRFEALLDDECKRTGERVYPPPTVLAVVPLLGDPRHQIVEPTDVAAWFLQLDDGRPWIVIERPKDPDVAPVDVLLAHMNRYNVAHRALVKLMMESTRLSRAMNAHYEAVAPTSEESKLAYELGGLAVDAAGARKKIDIIRRKIDFLSIFAGFAEPRRRFMALSAISRRFIHRYGIGCPSDWTMDPGSHALAKAFRDGVGRSGTWDFWIPPCQRLAERWEAWDVELRAFESSYPRLPLLDAIFEFRFASDDSGWPYSMRDPLREWIDSTYAEFPWPDALFTLGSDFPTKIREMRFWAGGWWRHVEGRGDVFYQC